MDDTETKDQKRTNNHHDRKHHEGKKHKNQKHQRSHDYERNADLINQDTQLPPLPKKNQYLPKPEINDYRNKEQKNRDQIAKLIEKKKQIRNEKFKASREVVKGEGQTHDQFKEEVQEFKEMKDRLMEVKFQRNRKRQQFKRLIDEAKENNAILKECRDSVKGSKENILERLEKMEHRLITADLSKQQEKQLNAEIMQLKRKVNEADSVGNLEVKLALSQQKKEQLDEQIQRLKEDKEPLEQEFKQLQEQLDKKNKMIEKIKGELKTETDLKLETKGKNEKEWEDWKDGKQKRIKEIEDKIKKIDEDTEKIWDNYNEKKQAYWEQKHKFDFIEWQHKVKNRKVNEKEREKRKLLMAEKDKEREKQEQKKKYINEIQLCNFLINYLRNLEKEFQNQKEDKKEESPQQVSENINEKMASDAQWKKQKGLEIIQSKKSKDEEQTVKKGKKHKKKKEEKPEEKKFEIPFNVQVMFQNLKLLAPESLQQIDKKVEELRERQALFDRACKEQGVEGDEKLINEIKERNRPAKKEEKNVKQEDFPSLS